MQPQNPTNQPSPQMQMNSNNYTLPSQIHSLENSMASLTKLLLEISNVLIHLRRELRGEALYTDDEGNSHWVQISKPTFIRINYASNKPYKKMVKMPWGEEKSCYYPNDEAIDEILSMLKFAGVNQISPISLNNEDNYLDDLREFECKLAAVLALKQREWGLDKELLPMVQFKIKTIVQDVRSMAVEGNTIKALQTNVQRVEQLIEGDKNTRRLFSNPYSS